MAVNPISHTLPGAPSQDPQLEDWAWRRKLAEQLMQQTGRPREIQHWTQGAAHLVDSLTAGLMYKKERDERKAAQDEAAKFWGQLIPKGPGGSATSSAPAVASSSIETAAAPDNTSEMTRGMIAEALTSGSAAGAGQDAFSAPPTETLHPGAGVQVPIEKPAATGSYVPRLGHVQQPQQSRYVPRLGQVGGAPSQGGQTPLTERPPIMEMNPTPQLDSPPIGEVPGDMGGAGAGLGDIAAALSSQATSGDMSSNVGMSDLSTTESPPFDSVGPQMMDGGVTTTAGFEPGREQIAQAITPTAGPLAQQYVDAVKKFEGYYSKPYWDYRQYTSGYGTKAKHPGEVIDKPEAERRLNTELASARAIVDKVAPASLSEGAKAALTSLTFNAGDKWTRSGLGAAVRAGNEGAIKERLLQYTKAGGKDLPGLVSRRQAEAGWIGQGSGKEPTPQQAQQGQLMLAQAGEGGVTPELLQQMLKNPYTRPMAQQMIIQQMPPIGRDAELARQSKELGVQGQQLDIIGKQNELLSPKKELQVIEGVPYWVDKRTQQMQRVQGFDGQAKVPEAVKTEAIKADNAFKALNAALDRYEQTVKRTGRVALPGQDKDAVKSELTNIQLQMKELYNLGVLNGPDLSLMQSMLVDPSVEVSSPLNSAANIMADPAARVSASVARVRQMMADVRNSKTRNIGLPDVLGKRDTGADIKAGTRAHNPKTGEVIEWNGQAWQPVRR